MVDASAQDERARLGDVQDIGEQITQFEDIDVTLAHEFDEEIVVTLSLGDVQDIVEEQIVAVGRSETIVCATGPAHHDTSQCADFGIDSVLLFGHCSSFQVVATRLNAAENGGS